jgi:tRNA U34 2-thiouridine synthase MnmA/TrmU
MCAVTMTAQGRPRLLRGLDANKDQSYFLYTLSEAQSGSAACSRSGDLEKTEVRRIAAAARAHHRQEEGLHRHLLHR